MTRTVVASASREVVIGFNQPFCVIGERINPSGRRRLAADMRSGHLAVVAAEALAQVTAGAAVLDVNAGLCPTGRAQSEASLLTRIVDLVQSAVDVPLSIDSADPEALEAGLEACRGRPLLNSLNGEDARLERLLALASKHDVPVVALCCDETGIPPDPERRFAIARKIIARAADHGVKPHDVIVDPLVLPASGQAPNGDGMFGLIGRLRGELKVNTICGVSNVSFGLAGRARRNAAFLKRAIAAGLTSAIMNPLGAAEMQAVRAACRHTGHPFPFDAETG